jgi:hypothetical protein
MNGLKEIVLVSHWFGHSPHCLECVLPFFLERGWQVYHLTDKPDAAGKYFSECGLPGHEKIRHLGMIEVQPRNPTRRRDAQLCRVEAHWEGVRLALEGLFNELGRKVGIFHTWVDLYSHEYLSPEVIQRSLPAPWVGLYVHPAELRIQKTWKRRTYENARDLLKMGRIFPSRLKAFNVPNARKIYFLDEDMPEKAKHLGKVRREAFPEWGERDGQPVPELAGFSPKPGQKIICLCGFLEKRKGLLTLLEAVPQLGGAWFFLFAGPIGYDSFPEEKRGELQDFVKNPPKNTLFINRMLSNREVNKVVSVSDLVYLAYEDFFHSSNIQIKAAHYKKPLIAGPRHLIAERTRRFGMGWCLPEILTTAVQELLGKIGVREIQEVRRIAKFDEFLSEHSEEVLEKRLEEISKLVV